MTSLKNRLAWMMIVLAGGGCTNGEGSNNNNNNNKAQQKEPEPKIHLVIDISNRQLSVFQNKDTIRNFPVAVGSSKYPTPTGAYKIHRIDWNPDWTPPDSEWTEGKEFTPPGHPDNPMGRVRIVYQMPYTIHGTENLESLGDAASHGSVRMANDDVVALAKLIMKESGTEKPEDWYNNTLADSTKMVQVDLKQSIPLLNKN